MLWPAAHDLRSHCSPDPRRRTLAAGGLSVLLAFLAVACADSRTSGAEVTSLGTPRLDSRQLTTLFDALRAGRSSQPSEVQALLSDQTEPAPGDPNWPVLQYLKGEILRQRGEIEPARRTFSRLASWAVSPHPAGPYGDTWGGSGLCAVAVWRWLQILSEHGPADSGEVDRALEVAEHMKETRLYSGMVRSGLLPALPLLEEEVTDQLAHVAWKNGRREAAQSIFLDFLAIDSRGVTLDPTDQEIESEILKRGLASRERLDLFRVRRQLGLLKTQAEKDRAAQVLQRLWSDRQAPTDVRAEAGYEWANYKRQQADRASLVQMLGQVTEMAGDDQVGAKALYRRGLLQSGEDQAADLLELRRRYPGSPLADDALFQTATEYLFTSDLDKALPVYEQLRGWEGANDYRDSAYYLPALGLLGRGRGDDIDAADRLLAEYLERIPAGVFRVRALFWRGRLAERRGDRDRAQSFFQQVVDEAPYDYYGLRARMHLEEGAAAVGRNLPAAGSATRARLREAFRASRVDTRLAGTTPYHQRLQAAMDSGLYGRLLEAERGIVKTFGRRLDAVPLEDFDAHGLMPAAALLLAVRQDALAAKDSSLTPDNWLRLAGLVGHAVHDWPASIEVTRVPGAAPRERLTDLQRDPRYLATLYANPADVAGLKAAIADAAWPIDGSKSLSESLMFAMIRHESAFYPEAISQVGALGLFQIMPATFSELDRKWHLLKQGGAVSDVEYLLDPARNVALWARWWQAELSGDDLVVAVMKHSAGKGNVSKWTYWRQWGVEGDVEYRIETIRFPETRNFVRWVLQDTALLDAAGFFEPGT